MIKKVISFLLLFSILFSIAGINSASATEYVNVKLEGKQPPLGTKAALYYQKAMEKKVPKVLTQKEIDQLMAEQEQQLTISPENGFGVVTTTLAGQTRDALYATVFPTVYNYSSETITEFAGLVDYYLETYIGSGQYAYEVTANAWDENIPPTLTSGWVIRQLTYAHGGKKTFWRFYGSYYVPGSTAITLKDAYANF